MKRRFLVAAGGMKAEDQSSFSTLMGRLGFAWWHWIDNVWLLVQDAESKNEKDKIVEELQRVLGTDGRWLVMELKEDIDWTASPVSNASGRRLSEWLISAWAGEN